MHKNYHGHHRAGSDRQQPSRPVLSGAAALLLALALLLPFLPSASATEGSTLAEVADRVGVTALYEQGLSGAGIDVAVIDTGVEPVPGLDGPDKILVGPDLSFEAGVPELYGHDNYGHGTVMASIIAGDDGPGGSYQGIAPGARILSMKVADNTGAVDVSQVIAAVDWVTENGQSNGLNVRVINLAYVTDSDQDYVNDPLAYAVERAWRAGYVVVASAGNGGGSTRLLGNPASDPFVIAVAAADEKGEANFSSRGSKERMPDVLAPGTQILGLAAPQSRLAQANPSALVDGRYLRGSGTSQATAVVSGAAALLLEQRPELTPDQVKALLIMGTVDEKGNGNGGDIAAIKAQTEYFDLLDTERAFVAEARTLRAEELALNADAAAMRSEADAARAEADQVADEVKELKAAEKKAKGAEAKELKEAAKDLDKVAKELKKQADQLDNDVEKIEEQANKAAEKAAKLDDEAVTALAEVNDVALPKHEQEQVRSTLLHAEADELQAEATALRNQATQLETDAALAVARAAETTGSAAKELKDEAKDLEHEAKKAEKAAKEAESEAKKILKEADKAAKKAADSLTKFERDLAKVFEHWDGNSFGEIKYHDRRGAGLIDVERSAAFATPAAIQNYPEARGDGSLEASRGTTHVVLPDGTSLTGEVTFTGAPWSGVSWSGVSWSGSSWSGVSWSGASWSGSSWSGSSWSGASWSGDSWSGVSWSGVSWSGVSWSGVSWSGVSWSGVSWSGATWS